MGWRHASVCGFIAVVVACSANPTTSESTSTSTSPSVAEQTTELRAPVVSAGRPVPIQRMTKPGDAPPKVDTPRVGSPPGCTAPFQYFGGHVLARVKVATVYWGNNVDGTVKASLGGAPGAANFYSDVLNSPYTDWLEEYDTYGLKGVIDGLAGSNQTISRGSYIGDFTITPSISATTITNDQIGAELIAQINAGKLPAPTFDCDNNPDTLYMFEFPQGISISLDGSLSCAVFCAYHFTTTLNGKSLAYGVHPYMGPGSACAGGGCGGGTYGQYLTSVHSHELFEAMTDTEVGLDTGNNATRPIAWYADGQGNCGEIGDICNGQQATVSVNGRTWTVQKQWSNRQNACVSGGTLRPMCTTTNPEAPASCRHCTCVDDNTASGCTGATPHCEVRAANVKYQACVQCTSDPQCSAGQQCQQTSTNATDDTCFSPCVPKTCKDLAPQCGTLSDGCGGTLTCTCTAPQTCGGGGTAGVCGCTPTPCTAGQCGPHPDGCGGTHDCGGCTAPQTCGGGGTAGVCGCTPTACTAGQCGMHADGCGGMHDCGGCTAPQTCGGGGTAGVCGCTPTACAAGQCGVHPDGCGGTHDCGNCTAPQSCNGGGGDAGVCGCTPTTCAKENAKCGSVPDKCGATLSCGTCAANESCVQNQCVPNATPDAGPGDDSGTTGGDSGTSGGDSGTSGGADATADGASDDGGGGGGGDSGGCSCKTAGSAHGDYPLFGALALAGALGLRRRRRA